jgi:hypothetical protein
VEAAKERDITRGIKERAWSAEFDYTEHNEEDRICSLHFATYAGGRGAARLD